MNPLSVAYSAGAVLIAAGLLLLARVAYSKLARFDVEHELTEADNPAVGLAFFGFIGGLVIVLAALLSTGTIIEPNPDAMAWDLLELLIYGVFAVVLLKLSGWLNDRLILHRFENKKELVDDRNLGAGAVLCGSYLASGLVLAGAFGGRVDPALLPEDISRVGLLGHELLVALAFYAIGQVALALYGFIYQKMQPRDVHDAIERDYQKDGVSHGGNAAAGFAFGGNLAALGVVMWGGARYDFEGWDVNLVTVGIATAVGLVVLPLWRVFVDKVMLSRADLAKEIFDDRNVNAALLEVASVLGLATVLALTI